MDFIIVLQSVYFCRFLDEYKKNGLTFWAITTANEPTSPVFQPTYIINSMLASPQIHRMWYKHHLYPTLKQSQHSSVKLITFDDLRMFVNWWIDRVSLCFKLFYTICKGFFMKFLGITPVLYYK